MKPAAQFLPPRSSVIYANTRRMLDASALCVRKFAMRVAEQYVTLHAVDQRSVPFRWGATTLDDLIKAEKHNAQILGRYMDGTVKALPADLEDAWVMSLPEPYRSDCERDLAARRGLLSVKLDDACSAAQVIGLGGDLAHAFGDMFRELAPAIEQGRFSALDLPHAKRILGESDDLISAVLRVRRCVLAIAPGLKPSG